MIGLTVNISIFNLTRVGVVDVDFREDDGVALVKLEARCSTANGGDNFRYGTFTIAVVDGLGTPATASQKVVRNATPNINIYTEAIAVVSQVNIPSGFTNLKNAWFGAANNKAARRAAAETRGLADGWIDASLAGAVS
ncbi:MAG: hypothetical protein ACJ8GN_02135 [Longimicrobiaceae bacterium]